MGEARSEPTPEHRDELARLRADLAAQSSVARVLAEAPTLAEAAPRLLDASGHGLGWEVGSLWAVAERERALGCRATWHDGEAAPAFERLSAGRRLACGE